jgi:3-oxoacyl-[acyl-carrier protein] reductase
VGRLDDRVAVVTGAGRGIGAATAKLFAAEGASVVVNDVDPEPAEATVGEITAAGGQAVLSTDNAVQAEGAAALVAKAVKGFGKLDILVNNAAITRDTLALRMKLEDWDAVLRTNLTGAHLCIQQALGAMLKQRAGRIINISSVVAETGNAGQANYVASKAGLIGLTRAIAIEVASRNITVNAIAPGFIATPMTDPLSQELKDKMKAMIPLGRFGAGRDVAAAIVFLASDEAGYVTGQVLDVNGGLHMG